MSSWPCAPRGSPRRLAVHWLTVPGVRKVASAAKPAPGWTPQTLQVPPGRRAGRGRCVARAAGRGSVPGRDAVPCRGRSRAEDRRDDRRRRGAAHTRRPRTYSSGAGRLRGERVGGSGARRLPPRDLVNRRDLPRAGRAGLGRPIAAGGDACGFGSGPLRPLSVSGRPGRGGDPRTPSGRLAARPQRCGVARGLPDAQVRRAGRDQTQRGRQPLSGALGGPGPLCLLTNARKPWATQAPLTLISAR